MLDTPDFEDVSEKNSSIVFIFSSLEGQFALMSFWFSSCMRVNRSNISTALSFIMAIYRLYAHILTLDICLVISILFLRSLDNCAALSLVSALLFAILENNFLCISRKCTSTALCIFLMISFVHVAYP